VSGFQQVSVVEKLLGSPFSLCLNSHEPASRQSTLKIAGGFGGFNNSLFTGGCFFGLPFLKISFSWEPD